MKPQELRIGNLVEYNGLPWKVSGIQSPKPYDDNRFNGKWVIELFDGAGLIDVTIDKVKAIPISEEWLRKFGYWWDNVDLHFTQMVSPITIENNSQPRKLAYSIFLSNARDSGESFLCVIKHLHQLQNIFYNLKGEELTLTK